MIGQYRSRYLTFELGLVSNLPPYFLSIGHYCEYSFLIGHNSEYTHLIGQFFKYALLIIG